MNTAEVLSPPIDVESQVAIGMAAINEVLALEATLQRPSVGRERPKPTALEATEVPMDSEIQAQFRRRFLGAIGLQETVETTFQEAAGPTLASAIERAAEGDAEANALVDINIATAAAEGCFKDDYVSRSVKNIAENNEIMQFGLNLHQLHYNSYTLRSGRSDELRQFTLAEALNGYREQEYLHTGLLEDYMIVTASCVPTDLPEEALDHRGDGYFTRTMTYCLQGTTQQGDTVVTDSTFRRGTAAPETASYEERQAKRYDLEAIGMVYESLGFEAPKMPLELLQRPLLLKKSAFPNGIVDVLRRCDIAGDVLQDIIRDRREAEYQQLIIESARKDASLADVRVAIKRDLLAAAGTFEEHEDANHLLWKLVREHAVPAAGTNHAINAIAFGPQAATYIREAREADTAGNIAFRDQLLEFAAEVAVVTGCGGGSCGLEGVDPDSNEGVSVKSKLQMESGDTLVHDTARACKSCRKVGNVYYAYNASKVNKLCSSCGEREIKGKRQDSKQAA